MDHSYEELRSATLDILSGREPAYSQDSSQYSQLQNAVSDLLVSRASGTRTVNTRLSPLDSQLFLELFWDCFVKG